MSAGISAPHDPHPPRPPLGIHEPHPGPRASLPASLCPPRPITRRVTPSLSTEADVCKVSPDCILWNPAGEGAGAPRGASSWSAGIPARIALPTTPHHKTCHAKPVDRGRRVQSLTRLHLVEPCRRGRRRSQGGLILVRGHPCPHRLARYAVGYASGGSVFRRYTKLSTKLLNT